MILFASSPLVARRFSSVSCSSVQHAGCSKVAATVLVIGLCVDLGLADSELALTMMMGYWYAVLGKWRDWIVKFVV